MAGQGTTKFHSSNKILSKVFYIYKNVVSQLLHKIKNIEASYAKYKHARENVFCICYF